MVDNSRRWKWRHDRTVCFCLLVRAVFREISTEMDAKNCKSYRSIIAVTPFPWRSWFHLEFWTFWRHLHGRYEYKLWKTVVVLFCFCLTFCRWLPVSLEKKCHLEELGSQNDHRKSLEKITSHNNYPVGNYLEVQVVVWTHPLIN